MAGKRGVDEGPTLDQRLLERLDALVTELARQSAATEQLTAAITARLPLEVERGAGGFAGSRYIPAAGARMTEIARGGTPQPEQTDGTRKPRKHPHRKSGGRTGK